jgi:uncharacterized protein YwgA
MSEPQEQTRKTVSFTHKQLGMSGLVGAILLAIQPMLSKFQTTEGSDAKMEVVKVQLENQAKQIDEIKLGIREVNENVKNAKEELVTTLRRTSDVARIREEQTEQRHNREIDGIERRLTAVEEHKNTKRN